MGTDTLLAAATAAIVDAHEAEMRAVLNNEVPENQWRPQKYAKAVLAATEDYLLSEPGRAGHAVRYREALERIADFGHEEHAARVARAALGEQFADDSLGWTAAEEAAAPVIRRLHSRILDLEAERHRLRKTLERIDRGLPSMWDGEGRHDEVFGTIAEIVRKALS